MADESATYNEEGVGKLVSRSQFLTILSTNALAWNAVAICLVIWGGVLKSNEMADFIMLGIFFVGAVLTVAFSQNVPTDHRRVSQVLRQGTLQLIITFILIGIVILVEAVHYQGDKENHENIAALVIGGCLGVYALYHTATVLSIWKYTLLI